MFDFQDDYRFAWPVKVAVPTDAGQEVRIFTGRFRLVPKKELEAAIEADPANSDESVGRLALVGWGEDLTYRGAPRPFSEAVRDELIGVPFVRYAIAKAYFEAISGAHLPKNS